MRGERCPCVVVRHVECPIHGREFGVPRVVGNVEVRAFLETLASEPSPGDPGKAWRWAHDVASSLIQRGA
jgi:hypothetical protein